MIGKLVGAILLLMVAASAFSEPQRGRFLTPEKREALKQQLLSRPAFQNNESKENRDLSGSQPPQRIGESLTREPDPAARMIQAPPEEAKAPNNNTTPPSAQVAPVEVKPADATTTARREPPFRRVTRQPSSLPARMNWIWLFLGVTLGVVATIFLRRNK